MNAVSMRRARAMLAEERKRAAIRGHDHLVPLWDVAYRCVQACLAASEDTRPARERAFAATQLSGDPAVAPTQWHGGYAETTVEARS